MTRHGTVLAALAAAALPFDTTLAAEPLSPGGPYLGGGVGIARYSDAGIVADTCGAFGFTCPADGSDSGFKLFAGYQFGRYVALEGAYVSLGKTQAELPADTRFSAEVQGVTLGLVPRIPVGERLDLFGKVGVMAWHVDLKAASPALGLSAQGDGAGADPTFGAGVAYRFHPNASLRLEWDRYTVDEDVESDGTTVNVGTDIDMFSANISLHF
jgi:OOP family OmpA-OmpF porin